MRTRISTVRCTHVVAQVSLGYYDEEGNLVGEELYPQADGNPLAARLFHPHTDQLAKLIGTCVDQAWAKVTAASEAEVTAAADGRDAAARNDPDQRPTEREPVPGHCEQRRKPCTTESLQGA